MILAVLAAATPFAAGAQALTSRSGARIEVGGYLHSELASSSAPDGRAADFFIRRARLEADLGLTDRLRARIQVELSGGTVSLQDAWARLSVNPFFVVDVGQFKRAFDPFELARSTELELVERDGRIDGLDACSGVGGICSFSRLTEGLQYSGRDVGLRVHGIGPEAAYDYAVTLTKGGGAGTADENDAKSAAGRVTVAVGRRTRLGFDVSVHDYVDPVGDDRYAHALGAEMELGGYRGGLHARAAVVRGGNWGAPDASGNAPRFLAAQALLSYYRALGANGWLEAVEPTGRVSWADPDTGEGNDGGVLLTPGVLVYLHGLNRVGANLDVYAPQEGDTELSLKLMWFLYF